MLQNLSKNRNMMLVFVVVSVLLVVTNGSKADFLTGADCTKAYVPIKIKCNNATYATAAGGNFAADCNEFVDCFLANCNTTTLNKEWASAQYAVYDPLLQFPFGVNYAYACNAAAVVNTATVSQCICKFQNTGYNFSVGGQPFVSTGYRLTDAGALGKYCTDYNATCSLGTYTYTTATRVALTFDFWYVANATYQPTWNLKTLDYVQQMVMNYTVKTVQFYASQFVFGGSIVRGNGTLSGAATITVLSHADASAVNTSMRMPSFKIGIEGGNLTIGPGSAATVTTTTTTTSAAMMFGQIMVVAASVMAVLMFV